MTVWQRIEGITVDPDVVEGQEARIADPYWLLCRQWLSGELTGDDAASPISVEAEVLTAPITRFQPGPPGGNGPIVERAALGLPLEAAVEREPVRSGPAAVRLAAEAGLQLYRYLDGAGAPTATRDALRKRLRATPGPGRRPRSGRPRAAGAAGPPLVRRAAALRTPPRRSPS